MDGKLLFPFNKKWVDLLVEISFQKWLCFHAIPCFKFNLIGYQIFFLFLQGNPWYSICDQLGCSAVHAEVIPILFFSKVDPM